MKKYKKWGIILAIIVTVSIGVLSFYKQLAMVAFDVFFSGQVEEILDKSYQSIEGKEEVNREITEPFSILLLGIDQRNKEIGRSDTIIYAVVRPQENKVLLLSIPRDTYTQIIGKGLKTKLNHAYAYGRAKMSIESVENLLAHKVDHYALINFKGIKDIVNALGGVELPITKSVTSEDPHHKRVPIHTNKKIYTGEQALDYLRDRRDSDMNRTMRHRIFLHQVMHQAIKLDTIKYLPQFFEVMGENFVTDMRPKYIIDLAKNMSTNNGAPSISNYMLHGKGKMINGVWYYIPDKDNLDYIKNLLDNWRDKQTSAEELIEPRQVKID